MKYLFIIIILIGSTDLMYAQEYSKVLNPSDSNLSFKEQAKKINQFFDTATGKNRGGYKQWKRKEWFALQHLSTNGKVADFGRKNFEIQEQISSQRNLSPANINAGNWQSIGYNTVLNGGLTARQGRVNCIAFHPTNPDIIYIGTAGGGIWKSTNGGLFGNWVNISDNLPVTSFSGLTIAPDGNTIYALTGDGFDNNVYFHDGVGVLKSIDGGNSWQRTGLSTTIQQMKGGYKIRMHPSNSNIVFAATNTGLWRTLNAGSNWTNIAPGEITDFEFKPGNNDILYYTEKEENVINKIELSTLTKTSSLALITARPVTRIEIGVTPANPNVVYALVGPNYLSGTWIYNGLYFSNDEGTSFSLNNNSLDIFSNNEQSMYDIAIHISPNNVNELTIAGVRSYRSTDGGINFSTLNETTATNLHGDVHAIERNPLNGIIYMGDDGGIYRSTDNGISWSNISLNLVINEFYRIAGFQANGNLILGGTQDNGQFLQKNLSGIYDVVIPGLDGMDNIIDYSNPNIMYACTQNGAISKSTDGGATPFTAVAVPAGGGWITPILQSPSASNTIFYGSNSGVLRSTNGGSSWSNIGGYNTATAMAISNTGSRLIITDGEKIKISNNPNAASPTWSSEINPRSTITFNIIPISSIAINPANTNDIMLSLPGYDVGIKVIRSTDGGINWTNYSINLPNIPIYAIAFGSSNNNPIGAVYIGTEIGVFYKDDNQPGWEPFYNGLPRVPVTDIHVDYSSGFVIAATFGRGLWRSEGHSDCPNSHMLSDEVSGNRFYQAAATINSSQYIPGTAGNSLKLRAAITIRLTNGFRAKEGSYFQAVNAACGSNVVLPLSRNKRSTVKKMTKVLKK